MATFASIVGQISGWLYSYVLIILLIAAGLYFTFRTKFVQFRLFGESFRVVSDPKTEKHHISSFEALMVSTASRVGTGNIVGVSTAVCFGGAGAMFWMWVIAVLGGASAFIESTLAQIYKRKAGNGRYFGGPSYYIETALHSRVLAIVFAISLIATYAVGFNLLASYNMSMAFNFAEFSIDPKIVGAILGFLTLITLLGGGTGIIKVSSFLVPIMAIFYVLLSLAVIIMHIKLLPAVLLDIFSKAFDFKAIFSGFMGSAVMYGIKRGLYSNEAGVGSAPNAAASAVVSHPVKQGLVQMLSVFIDTLLLCSATGFMMLCSGTTLDSSVAGVKAVQNATMTILGHAGPYFIAIALSLFGFTTIIGNLFYVRSNLDYIKKGCLKNKAVFIVFSIVCSAIVFIGSGLKLGLVWDLSDVLMGIMALINIPTIIILGKKAVDCLNDYVRQKKEGKDPVFTASSIGITDCECWEDEKTETTK